LAVFHCQEKQLQEPKESDIPSGPRLSDPPESTANGKLCTARYADAR